MKNSFKRIQFIHRKTNGICRKFWQNIDSNQMITLEHVWNHVNQQMVLSSAKDNYEFYCYKTKQLLPVWYHVDLLNDNDQILIDESASMDKPSTLSNTEGFKHISKKKQINAFLTNRSFFITDKYSVSNDFYQEWEKGKMHENTNNYRKIF